ncbi:DUF6701 domain-containing protein [Enterovibrio sp. 27052020O]|uniref:DUF6701 domain-containing protein n=1 Tax=Enterovibrio sp. 27052020O TaxID=3241166 RepID=UPI00388F49D6
MIIRMFLAYAFIFSVVVGAEENICTLFPNVAQSFSSSGQLVMYGTSLIRQDLDAEFGLGFSIVDWQTHSNSCSNDGVNKFKCYQDLSNKVDKPEDIVLYHENGDLDVYHRTLTLGVDGRCASSNAEQCSYKDLTFESGTLNLKSGTYWFNNISFNGVSKLNIDGSVKMYANSINLNEDSLINNSGSPDDFILKVKGNSSFTGSSKFNALIYGEGGITLSNNVVVQGAMTVKNLELTGNAKLVGDSACFSDVKYDLNISPTTASASGCDRIPLTFSVQDANGVTQTHISGKLEVDVVSTNGHACWAVSGEPNARCMPKSLRNISVIGGQSKLWLGGIGDDIHIKGNFTPDDSGISKLDSVAGPYDFAPLGFRVRGGGPVKMVAGKPETIIFEAVKAVGNGQICKVDNKYEGLKPLVFSNHHVSPSVGTRNPYIDSSEITTSTPLDLVFNSEGYTEFKLTYLDAGKLSIDVAERVLDTAKASDSQQESEHTTVQNHQLKRDGQILVDSRPYTFAICDVKAQDKGKSNAGDAFTYAGAPFSANLKPVIWQTGDKTDSSLIDLSAKDYCARQSTPSFWHPDAPDARVTINNTAQVVTPTGGASASVSGATNQNHTEAINGRYEYPSLSLNNVGTFKLRSRVVDSYLGMTVNRADLPVGRFYPSHFMVTPEFESGVSRSHDSLHQGFTYLGQPFSGVYVITAATTFDTPVSNYHLRSDKAVFDGWVIDPVSGYPYAGTDLTTRWAFTPDPSVGQQGQWKAGENGESEWVIDGQMSIVKDAVPESPFTPLRFAVGAISFDQDNTDFVYCADASKSECEMRVIKPQGSGNPSLSGVQIATDDFYFGRMRIEGFSDTKTPFSEQTLPVAVEVFNGTHFVTNTRDNATIVSTEIGKKDVLFSDNAALQAKIELRDDAKNVVATKSVKEGRADFHVIAPDQSSGLNREQFRYWQQLDKAVNGVVPQTWLQHNWQGTQFDDDPSGIGIFGFYRGSDRVIYKGEKNITLTEE